jgi:hypothetical protein
MTRQEVKDYLGISESTYEKKVRVGVLRPRKLPGGDRFYKSQLQGNTGRADAGEESDELCVVCF